MGAFRVWMPVVVAFAAAGCADTEQGGPSVGGFAEVYDDVIAPRCTERCHQVEADPPAGRHDLVMTEEEGAYQALVDVPATRCEDYLLRVAPGNPEASLLWLKVSPGQPVCGFKMPPDCFGDECGVSSAEAALIFDWIASGAAP